MNDEQRIKELKTRQMYVDSSLIIKLRKEKGQTYYDVWGWLEQEKTDTKFIITTGIYADYDPLDIVQ